jgi:fatty acid desaturase
MMKKISKDQPLIDLAKLEQFSQDLQALKKNTPKLQSDYDAFNRLILSHRLMGVVGFILAGVSGMHLVNQSLSLGLSVVSIVFISLFQFASWTMIAHHWSHRGYQAQRSAQDFGRGKLRWLHWFDCIVPEAWHYEHDLLHHYHLGELHGETRNQSDHVGDPDVAQDQAWWLQALALPLWLKVIIIFVGAMFWKILYYAPNTLNTMLNHQEKTKIAFYSWGVWSPLSKRFWHIALKTWLPYLSLKFLILPAVFLLHSTQAFEHALICLMLSELLTNLHTFLVIVPNHSGLDLYRFDEKVVDKKDFYLRQVIGSCNYPTQNRLMDYLYGYLNYQIEHHVWPDLTMGQYRRIQPEFKALCLAYGVPYVQESLGRRVLKMVEVLTTQIKTEKVV